MDPPTTLIRIFIKLYYYYFMLLLNTMLVCDVQYKKEVRRMERLQRDCIRGWGTRWENGQIVKDKQLGIFFAVLLSVPKEMKRCDFGATVASSCGLILLKRTN